MAKSINYVKILGIKLAENQIQILENIRNDDVLEYAVLDANKEYFKGQINNLKLSLTKGQVISEQNLKDYHEKIQEEVENALAENQKKSQKEKIEERGNKRKQFQGPPTQNNETEGTLGKYSHQLNYNAEGLAIKGGIALLTYVFKIVFWIPRFAKSYYDFNQLKKAHPELVYDYHNQGNRELFAYDEGNQAELKLTDKKVNWQEAGELTINPWNNGVFTIMANGLTPAPNILNMFCKDMADYTATQLGPNAGNRRWKQGEAVLFNIPKKEEKGQSGPDSAEENARLVKRA